MSKTVRSILVFTQMFPKSGNDAVISGMIKNPFYQTISLSKMGCDIDVVSTGDSRDSYELDGVRVYSIGDGVLKGMVKSFSYELKMFIKYLSLSRNNSYDVIHVHHLNIPWLGLLKKMGLLKSHLVYTAHGTSTPELKAARQGGWLFYFLLKVNGKLQHSMDKWCWKQAELLLSPSAFQIKEMQELYAVGNKPVEVVYNGYDENLYFKHKESGQKIKNRLGIGETEKVVIFVGRAARKKGIDLLIKAMDEVRDTLSDTKLIIVMGFIGRQKDFRKQIYNMASEREYVILCENVPESDLASYYNAADLCVVPSLGYESIPTVIYEAMACGLPVLTQGAWGIPEVLNGDFLKESELKNKAFPKRIIQLLSDEELLNRYATENLKNVAQFSWRNGGSKLLAIFNKHFKNEFDNE